MMGNKRAKMAGIGLGLGTAGGGIGTGVGGGRSVSSRSAVMRGGVPRGGAGLGGSPTPRHQRDFVNYSQGQQRSVSYSSGIPSHSAAYPPSHTRLTTTTGAGGVKTLAPAPKRGYNPLGGEGEVRRAPRKSFKPRSSMAAVGRTGIESGVNGNGNGNGNGGGLGLGIEGLGGWREGLEGNDDGLEVQDDDVF